MSALGHKQTHALKFRCPLNPRKQTSDRGGNLSFQGVLDRRQALVSYSPALIPATGGLVAVTEGTSGPVRLCLAPQQVERAKYGAGERAVATDQFKYGESAEIWTPIHR
jgi:hypothetical protein